MKKIAFLAFLVVVFSLVVACGGTSNATGSPTTYTVTMSGVTFDTSTLSIPKGSTITFTTKSSGSAHNLVVGTNGHSQQENGAPDFGNGGQTVGTGQSWTTPPWNTAGTYHVTCTYHPTTMTLTVTVTA